MAKPEIAMIQTGLAGLGFAPGPVDGVMGPKTRAAVLEWLAEKPAVAPSPAVQAARGGPLLVQGSARHPVHEIVVHCAATKPEWMKDAGIDAQVAEIRRWHVRDRGWKDIGYHWVIGRGGELRPGRAETAIGAGVAGHNAGVIHICLIGGHGAAATDRFAAHFTERQDTTLRAQIHAVGMRTRIDRVSGHNEWAAKACPGFNVPQWLKEKG